MCQAIIDMKKEAYDSGWTEGHDSGWTEGKANAVVMTVLRMYEENCSSELISRVTGKSLKEIDEILQIAQGETVKH